MTELVTTAQSNNAARLRTSTMVVDPSYKTPQRVPRSTLKRRKTPSTRWTPSPRCSSRRRRVGLPTDGGGSGGGGDRFIPTRRQMNFDLVHQALNSQEKKSQKQQPNKKSASPPPTPQQKEFQRYLKSTVCGVSLDKLNEEGELKSLLGFGAATREERTISSSDSPFVHDILGTSDVRFGIEQSARKAARKIPTAPFKSLELPGFVDDFYLNVMSWSQDGFLAIGLDDAVYIFDCSTLQAYFLTRVEGGDNFVTSVSWCTTPGQTKYLAIGTNANTIELWDLQSSRRVRVMSGSDTCVTSLSWSSNWLSSGGANSVILQHDIRMADSLASVFVGHNGVVCGLSWNADGTKLASGSNDDTVCIWDAAGSAARRSSNGQYVAPQFVFSEHKSGVKALAWCPFRESVLASGGGAVDRSIKFWNTQRGTLLESVETPSQVTSLLWSKEYPELLSGHGFSGNQIMLWKYPTMTKVRTFQNHSGRVLQMAMSPNGQTVATAGADHVLHFWDMFGKHGGRDSATAAAAALRRNGRQTSSVLQNDWVLPGTPTIR